MINAANITGGLMGSTASGGGIGLTGQGTGIVGIGAKMN